MRKSSSDSSKGARSGARSTFGKDTGPKSYSKPSRPSGKKNYDGRESTAGADGPSRSSKPYSGRTTDGDRKPFGKPAFGKSEGKKFDSDRKPRKSFDGPTDGDRSERPARKFEERGGSDKPRFNKPDRKSDFADRGPRKEFDKPFRKDGESRPFSDRPKRSFDKPGFNKDRADGPRKSFDKPFKDGKKPFERPERENNERENNDGAERPRKSFDKPFRDSKKPFERPARDGGGDAPRKSFDKPFRKDGDRKPYKERPKPLFDNPEFNEADGAAGEGRPKPFSKPAGKPAGDSRPVRERPKVDAGKEKFTKRKFDRGADKTEDEQPTKRFSDVVNNAFNEPSSKNRQLTDDENPGKREQFEDKVYGELEDIVNDTPPKKPFEVKHKAGGKKKFVHDHSEGRKKKYKDEDDDFDEEDKEINQKDGPRLEMPLNKYIAHSGECSRRDAADVVRQGKVKVNGELVLDPGYRVQHDDKVTMSGKKLTPQKGMVYILLNKPKGFITTNDDPQGRKTVMQLVGNSGVDRLFPVGRLDRDTSGLLLITNDGDLTQKLCHPAYNVKKVYQVTLDKALTKADFDKIMEGVELEDGKAYVDAMSYLEKKNELGLEIHSGRNRIVRRIFESLGYVVDKLDRVMYAGLTKKNLPRSKWRYLDEREVVLLKHFKN